MINSNFYSIPSLPPFDLIHEQKSDSEPTRSSSHYVKTLDSNPLSLSFEELVSSPIPSSKEMAISTPEPFTMHSGGRKKRKVKKEQIRRIKLPPNTTPSWLGDPTGKQEEEEIKQHAFSRINFLFLTLAAYWNKMPLTSLESSMSVEAALLQATSSTLKGKQAAHSHLVPGLRANSSKLFQRSIIEHGMTESTKRVLQIKQFPAADIQEMETHSTDEAKINEIFNRHWAHGSLIEGTAIDLLVNATVSVIPTDVNLKCDKGIENKLRDKIVDLINTCHKGTCRPEEACDQAVKLIRNHITKAIRELSLQVNLIKQFRVKLAQCALLEKKLANGTIKAHDYDLYRTRLIELYEIKEKLEKERNAIAPCPLKESFKLYQPAFANIKKLRTTSTPQETVSSIRKLMNQRVPTRRSQRLHSPQETTMREPKAQIQLEMTQKIDHLLQLQTYYRWELEGTQAFDYGLYFKKEGTTTKHNRLSNKDLLDLTYQLIEPIPILEPNLQELA